MQQELKMIVVIMLNNNKKKIDVRDFLLDYGVLIALLLIVVVVSIATKGLFLNSDNIMNLLQQVTVNALLAVGMTYVILTAGIDLSVGSILAFSGMVTASFVTGDDTNLFLGIFLGITAGAFFGLLNGIVITRWNVAPFVATLGMMTIARGATYIYSDGQPISELSSSFLHIGSGYILGIPISVFITILISIIFIIILNKTRFGRHVYAVGGNEKAAIISGINANRVKIAVYTIAGLLAGIAGVIMTSRVSAGLPQAGQTFELDAIAAVVIGGTSLMGGKGRLWGALAGALLVGVLNNGMDIIGISSYWQQVVKGIIIIAAVTIDKKAY